MYVDESGDPGKSAHASPHFALSGLIINTNDWAKYLNRLKQFRKTLFKLYGLNQRIEIHANELIRINKIDAYKSIKKLNRIAILRFYCEQIQFIFSDAKVINVCFDKSGFTSTKEVSLTAWERLIQRYDTYLKKSVQDKGIIVADETDSKEITKQLRKMRVYNPVKSHYSGYYNALTDNIVEDLFQRRSIDSYFIQTVDVIVHSLYRQEFPKGSLKKFGVEKYFKLIEPIFLKEASKSDPLGIVRK